MTSGDFSLNFLIIISNQIMSYQMMMQSFWLIGKASKRKNKKKEKFNGKTEKKT